MSDTCLNCGYVFASDEIADQHNWCCTTCQEAGGFGVGIQDPINPDVWITPIGDWMILTPPLANLDDDDGDYPPDPLNPLGSSDPLYLRNPFDESDESPPTGPRHEP
jgi:hypothetical protein